MVCSFFHVADQVSLRGHNIFILFGINR